MSNQTAFPNHPNTVQPTNPSPVLSAQSQKSVTPTSQPMTGPAGQIQPMPQKSEKDKSKPKNDPNSTQNSLKIAELRDGLVILKDGTFRAVVACESINFDLMSLEEKEGVEYSYQNFINSLYFPIQILIRSQKVDIGPYLDKLVKIRNNQDNMLLNVLMDDYINYIDILAQEANIMEKTFYIVVPYLPAGDITSATNQIKGIFSTVKNKPVTNVKINEQVYIKGKEELQNRVNLVLSGLNQVGIRSERLDTQKLSQLYYSFYNPDTALQQPIVQFENITNIITRKGEGETPRPNLSQGEM
ncbi:MAG: hypothetical protein ACOX0Z_01180 [Candidatus Nanosyncoccaceae bacterium]|jgi:hypothetical protein